MSKTSQADEDGRNSGSRYKRRCRYLCFCELSIHFLHIYFQSFLFFRLLFVRCSTYVVPYVPYLFIQGDYPSSINHAHRTSSIKALSNTVAWLALQPCHWMPQQCCIAQQWMICCATHGLWVPSMKSEQSKFMCRRKQQFVHPLLATMMIGYSSSVCSVSYDDKAYMYGRDIYMYMCTHTFIHFYIYATCLWFWCACRHPNQCRNSDEVSAFTWHTFGWLALLHWLFAQTYSWAVLKLSTHSLVSHAGRGPCFQAIGSWLLPCWL